MHWRDARFAIRSPTSRRCSLRCWSIIISADFCRAAVALALAVALAACGGGQAPQFQLTDVTGVDFGKSLALTDHTGQRRTLADFKGKVVVLFFGFVHCPDVCPTTMLELANVARELGPDAARVQVLFVTVDPERDGPEVLRQYVPSFNPDFLGLHGTLEETRQAAREFKVFFQKQPAKDGGYSVDHSAGAYVIDPEGRLRLFAPYGAGAQAFLHDIRLLLAE
jgi:protein SCO1/2